MPASLLTPFRLRNAERHLGVYGIHLHREGHPPLEHRFRSDDPVNVYSCSKTVTALALGMALDEGLVSLDDFLIDHLGQPGGHVADGVAAITLRHLIHMTDGSSFTGFEPEQASAPDRAGAYLAAELDRPVGERFVYSNGATYMLGRVVSAASGTELRDYLMPRLFEPLGIANPQWFRCPAGYAEAATGLHLRTSELAAIGRLLLQDGEWEGRQLVSAQYVQAMRTDIVDTSHAGANPDWQAGYGYCVWRSTRFDSWRADGRYGQFSIVLPHHRAVVTLTSHNEANTAQLLEAVWEDVVPYL